MKEETLLNKKNVVGVAHGEKWTNGKNTHRPALLVFVEKKVPMSNLSPNDRIDKFVGGKETDVVGRSGEFAAQHGRRVKFRSPGSKHGVKQSSRKRGLHKQALNKNVHAEYNSGKWNFNFGSDITATDIDYIRDNVMPAWLDNERRKDSRPAARVNRQARVRPVVGGISVGNTRITAGTLGGIFRDSDDDLVILSNQHVLAGSNSAQVGETIVQPGTYDGGVGTDKVGTLKSYVPLADGVSQDSAIAKLNVDVRNNINYAGHVRGFGSPHVGMKVKKSGRTTGITSNRIIATGGTFRVNYGSNEVYSIRNCIVTEDMSKGGDSGSILMDGQNIAVGLLFAGSSTKTLFNPIDLVVNQYGLKLL